MNFINRRKFHRINFDGFVSIEIGDHYYDCCQIKDLSLTGIFVLGNFQQHHTKNCLVRIFHKEKSGNNSLFASGYIVWNSDEGIGLKFTKMTLANYILLQETLSKKAEEPVTILQEFPDNYPFEIHGI